MDCLIDHVFILHHGGVVDRRGYMIRFPVDMRALDGHHAVMFTNVLAGEEKGREWVDGFRASDNADGRVFWNWVVIVC